ncbi:Conserved oligomeric Golgi complex subunit 2 [Frankliniella fusca]|uniref:Conserved oligomeric Golgi complex subunit 2 n=1 Tax=Frankliniella fusca TaxID=407009 RepID=A0AAE1HQE3_9NEOP|nr:Conserved oligomeric Golgi complex subunit 2 [Frankliniella fusca]
MLWYGKGLTGHIRSAPLRSGLLDRLVDSHSPSVLQVVAAVALVLLPALQVAHARAPLSAEITQRAHRPRGGAHKGMRLTPNFHEFHHCLDKEHFLRITSEETMLNEYGDELWNVGFNLSEPTKSFRMFKVVIHKCSLTRDACEYWNTWSWDVAVCSLLFLNNTVWAPLVQRIEPKLTCPVLAGPYQTVNASLDFNSVEQATRGFMIDKNSWRVEVQLYNELRDLYLCFSFLAKLTRVKIRN